MNNQKYIELLEKELEQKDNVIILADNLFDIVYYMYSKPTTYAQIAKALEDYKKSRNKIC